MTLKDDIDDMREDIIQAINRHMYHIQNTHEVGISEIDVSMMDTRVIMGPKEYVVGDVKIRIDV